MPLNLQTRLMLFLLIPTALINLCTFMWAFVYSRESLIEQWIRGANAKLEYAADRIGCRLEDKVFLLRALQQAESAPQGPLLRAFLVQLLASKHGVRLVDIRKVRKESAPDQEQEHLAFKVDTKHDVVNIVSMRETNEMDTWLEVDVAIEFGSLIDEIRRLHLWKGANALLVGSDGYCLAATEHVWVNRHMSDFRLIRQVRTWSGVERIFSV